MMRWIILQFAQRLTLASTQRLARRSIVTAGVALVLSCNSGKEAPPPAPFTADELYLIESYARIRTAQSHYPGEPVVAESLFAILETDIDSLRIVRTVQEINRNTERWIPIFSEIETRIQQATHAPSPAPSE